MPCSYYVWGAGEVGNVDAVRSWVASGADINVVDANGTTPLMKASGSHRADIVAEMLRLGADARRVSITGLTALHHFAGSSREVLGEGDIVRLLVAAGCDPAARDNDGRTAVDFGGGYGRDEWSAAVEAWVAAAVA